MGTRLRLGSEKVTTCLEEEKFALLTPKIKMKGVSMLLCVAVVLTPHLIRAHMLMNNHGYGPGNPNGYGKKDTLTDSARDEISRLVKTLHFYDELMMEDEKMKMEGVADDAEKADETSFLKSEASIASSLDENSIAGRALMNVAAEGCSHYEECSHYEGYRDHEKKQNDCCWC